MNCEYFSKCGSCTLYDKSYEEQLSYKIEIEKNRFKEFNIEEFDIIKSEPSNFRSRAEFRVWKNFDEQGNTTLSYAMNGFNKNTIEIANCSIVSSKISNLMQPLLSELEKNNQLREKLFSIEFLSSKSDKVLVTLIYHKKLDEEWKKEANLLQNFLNIKIIGRSRGQKVILEDDFITNSFNLGDNLFHIRQYEGSFTQPNEDVNTLMISWVLNHIKPSKDLCELYCGGGNFTIPLSKKFDKVLATEISKTSIKSAKESCLLNNIENIEFIRMSAEEFVQALNKQREFNRLKDVDLNKYSFNSSKNSSTIFVDPPRAGLDETTRALAKEFEQIIYISCNADTLHRDLQYLCKTHTIEHFAFFDQFAYTKHIECGVVLQKNK